jgi:hypothetical protein
MHFVYSKPKWTTIPRKSTAIFHCKDLQNTDIGCFKNIRCLLVGRALFVPDAFHRTRGFPDIGCLADIRCLTKMNSVWGNKIGFGIMICRRGRMIIRPYNFPRHRMFQKHPMSFGRASAVCSRGISSNKGIPDIGCLADIRCLTKMNSVWGNEIGFGIMIFRKGE